jgi:hypothetical protein
MFEEKGDRLEFRKFGILLGEEVNLQEALIVSRKLDKKFGQLSCGNG